MFSHIMIGSNDIARSKKFYDALFAAMGAQPGTEDARGRLAYSHNGGTSIEDPPGVRPNGAYLAYLRDPDGHKLVGVAR
jgi:catechol 2,3-dioxygenase-like lactoylglutathione lyase family enzyme